MVNAKAGKATTHSIAVFAPVGIITDNAKVTATADEAAEFSIGLASSEAKILNAATVEASGFYSALYSSEPFEILNYTDPYILVSKDTNPENAVVWDGTSNLESIENNSEVVEVVQSEYKYVLIAPEAPAEPEPEKSFFEQLIDDIASFFEMIIAFFTSLFTFAG